MASVDVETIHVDAAGLTYEAGSWCVISYGRVRYYIGYRSNKVYVVEYGHPNLTIQVDEMPEVVKREYMLWLLARGKERV